MNMVVYADDKQMDEVDVTIKLTMKLKEWKMVSDALRKDSKDNYHWTKAEVALAIEQVFNEYHSLIQREKQP